ncbi:type I restriction endonuclease, partial [Sedimentibacter sp. B4]|uniref:type I restriction endonuclease n=1 Tax=Sedimentibacter sp. B4 TaxID=304766 RepID=UPI0012FCE00E
ENRRFHEFLVHGFRGVTYLDNDGAEQNPTVRLVSADPVENDWVVAQQVRLDSAEHHRRFDVVWYLNGLPVVV